MEPLKNKMKIEHLSSALVREYLYRKDLVETLRCMDRECPRTSESINSRGILAQELSIEDLIKRNREQETPFKTMIELIVQAIQGTCSQPFSALRKRDVFQSKCVEIEQKIDLSYLHRGASSPKRSGIKPLRVQENSNIINSPAHYAGRSRDRCLRDEESAYHPQQSDSHHPQATCSYKYPQATGGRSAKTSSSHSELQQSRWDYVLGETNNVLRAKENVLLSSLKPIGDADDVDYADTCLEHNPLSNVLSCLHKLKTHDVPLASQPATGNLLPTIQSLAADLPPAPKSATEAILLGEQSVTEAATSSSKQVDTTGEDSQRCLLDETDSEYKPRLKSSDCDILHTPSNETDQLPSNVVDDANLSHSEPNIGSSSLDSVETDLSQKIPTRIVYKNLWTYDPQPGANIVMNADILNENFLGTGPEGESATGERGGEVVVEFLEEAGCVLDEEDEEESGFVMDNRPGMGVVTVQVAAALKEVVVGSATASFNRQWLDQAFTFNTNQKLKYGFVQNKGGPCGVMATVQAFLVKTLLFEADACTCTEPLRPTTNEATAALVTAISDVLWRAASTRNPTLVISTGDDQLAPPSDVHPSDVLTETLSVVTFGCRATLQQGVQHYLEQFTTPGARGCVLLVLSAVLSRGILSVREDMDEATPLIATNGHCTLELVNLLLIGRAVSNVFDNNVKLDSSCVLRGVHTRADVGFLSLYEHYNSCQVGTFLKTPRYPVWVVCSEGHFTVLFSCRRELVSDWRAEKCFNLFYYDTMAKRQDEIKLTVDTTGLHLKTREDGYVVPPLEHCIRTKWKGAVVDWNGACL